MDISQQEQIDRAMCKPGYTWNPTLKRCLGAGGGQPAPDVIGETPDGAIAMEKASRETTGEVL